MTSNDNVACIHGKLRDPYDGSNLCHDCARERQRAGLCPWHDRPEFGCEPCADKLTQELAGKQPK